jgi:predicted ester cyclase
LGLKVKPAPDVGTTPEHTLDPRGIPVSHRGRDVMSVEENKAIVRRVTEEVWNQGNASILGELLGPAMLADTAGHHAQNIRQMAQTARLYRTAFPDLRVTIDDLLGEGEQALVRFTLQGTHTGAVQGVAGAEVISGLPSGDDPYRTLLLITPTGRAVTIQAVALFGFGEGKVSSFWVLMDEIELLRQVGALPMIGTTPHS